MTLTLRSAMTTHPHSIRAGETLRTAERMMDKLHVHHLPVRDAGKVVGVITDSDIAFAARVQGDVDVVVVEDACADDVVSVDVDTDLAVAVGIMLERRVDSVLVMQSVENGEPVLEGIFTLTDAARALHQLLMPR
jgi:CBS domain-containing protein